jgi:hypothetical protein
MATPRRDALTRFTDELIRLRTLAGAPSLNQLAVLTAELEHPLARSTVSDKLTAKSVPDWDFVVSFVTGCRLYATNTGVPLAADLVDLSRWEAAHWQMLSDMDRGQSEDRLAVAARAQLARRGGRRTSPKTERRLQAFPGDDGELAALAGLLEELRAGAGGTVVVSVTFHPSGSATGATE